MVVNIVSVAFLSILFKSPIEYALGRGGCPLRKYRLYPMSKGLFVFSLFD